MALEEKVKISEVLEFSICTIPKIENSEKFGKVSFTSYFDSSFNFSLKLFSVYDMYCHTYHAIMKLDTLVPYLKLKEEQKNIQIT